jgi:hypothetical protein
MNNIWRRLRPLPAASLVVRRRHLIVVPRPLPHCASQGLDRCARPMSAAPRRYLIVVPRPLSATTLVVRRSYLIVVPSPKPATQHRYLIVVPRPLSAAPLVVRRRYLIILRCLSKVLDHCAQAITRDAAHCASQVRDRGVQAAALGAATLMQQEKNNSADVQRSRVHISGFICTVVR